MAEIPMSGHDADPAGAGSIGPLVSMIGALASLALVVGTGVWGYKLLMRDVSGVPVVRAVEGPMRIQPDDPGGSQADHQGLAVNRVAADGSAAAPADRLTLAPAPIALDEEDGLLLRNAPLPVQPASLPGTVEAAPAPAPKDEIIAPPRLTLAPAAGDDSGGEKPAASGADRAANEPAAKANETAESKTIAAADKVFTNGVGRSLRPVLRPDDLGRPVKVAALSDVVAPAEAPPSLLDADQIPVGTHLVQLGAFASAEIAAEEWDKLGARFRDYLDDKTRIIQQASSGGRVFYRLRAMGFADLSDARRMCSALKAERADCIPVTIR
ncbi:SPOR domain-containing protein [Shimia sp.]|uniref:SPOR domain-containing protein n=1 Tax=Shimia sp. TaxID=1954381 RepID=UPI003568F72D